MVGLQSEIKTRVQQLAEEASQQEGCQLYDWEFVGGQGAPVLRVYIDREPMGVSIDDCANVSRCLNLLLDSEDLISHSYELEVSSPGLERSLREAWHFAKAVGQKVKVKTHNFVQSKQGHQSKSLQGILKSFSENQVLIEDDGGGLWQFPVGEISRARTLFVFPGAGEKAGAKQHKPKQSNEKQINEGES